MKFEWIGPDDDPEFDAFWTPERRKLVEEIAQLIVRDAVVQHPHEGTKQMAHVLSIVGTLAASFLGATPDPDVAADMFDHFADNVAEMIAENVRMRNAT